MYLLYIFRYTPLPIRMLVAKVAFIVSREIIGFIIHFQMASEQAGRFRDHTSKRCVKERNEAELIELESVHEEINNILNLKGDNNE